MINTPKVLELGDASNITGINIWKNEFMGKFIKTKGHVLAMLNTLAQEKCFE